ncbi:TRAP transporter solute receptor, unknown substrate 3 [Planococcus halocryophilus Or1]|uniref:TRAP transporter n=1 Tax=Planococcus halocryophilus TaxID=1215089 RepID=A0A1C7DSF4_9BACL|nr:TRAP transporter substrate-binding protein DctP [Planococcus halocryophilus]ANU14221.1 TRAP transporter [Planococcus halocryophilus]EMF46053.1 TRAP transporter solute receptor, unknown substrate 3 [Planococcus halocryophilus Or1]
MKSFKSRFSIAGLGVVFLLSGCGDTEGTTASSEDETITLRAATGLSAQHAWWEASMVPWMERVEELTEGQVQFESFTSGELVSVPDEAEALETGTVDVALVLPIYQPDQFPMAEVTMLPLNHSDTLIASKAWKKLLESEEELADGKTYSEMQFGDFKVFPISTTQEYSISTTGHEFNTVSDVEGTSLRTPSRIHEMYAAKTGINSVTMPAVEIFDSLSRGTFEGAFYSIADWTGYGFQDLFRYTLTGINFGHFNSFIGMSQERWEEMPENVQEAMIQANEEIFEPGAQEWINRAEKIIPENEANGGKFVDFADLDPAVQDHFNNGIEETWTDYAALLEENGLPGNDLIKMWRDLLIEEGGEVPESIMNLE